MRSRLAVLLFVAVALFQGASVSLHHHGHGEAPVLSHAQPEADGQLTPACVACARGGIERGWAPSTPRLHEAPTLARSLGSAPADPIVLAIDVAVTGPRAPPARS